MKSKRPLAVLSAKTGTYFSRTPVKEGQLRGDKCSKKKRKKYIALASFSTFTCSYQRKKIKGHPGSFPHRLGFCTRKKYTVSSFARRPPEGAQEEPIRKYHGKSGIK
jgi:hypothetical protein